MKIGLIAVGRLKSGPERELVERYRLRAEGTGRSLGFTGPDIVEIVESRARREADRRAEEADALRAKIATAPSIAFDERGVSLASDAFAQHLAALRDAGRPMLALVIGGPDGLDPSLRDRADLVLAFGALTLPHQLVRVLVAEQFYRALTILSGHPYHRGD